MSLKLRKSKAPPPPPGCPIRACMSLLGGAWTTNVVWQLSGGPRRFGELIHDIPGISPKVLTTRLRELTEKGAVTREVLPTSPPSVEYALSALGQELVPVIDAIVRVGTRLREVSGAPHRHDTPTRRISSRRRGAGAVPGHQGRGE
ncbi:helix-turn-helix transcriptional regulator [Myxococcus sp. K15C18031901]|uniref:winged helix-turn-helix transcriptional regulator n=1 Tax=Myxococcus dinghuensis TaxID=2906761 RepID=UPI0020A6FC4E|nr:helix-turn-helix domain-containing protein [Myxococcus dinghuensis]MCP3100198.1 helix-turn-helix transcriptional regulator [Myxococcus dinghuensis]